MPEPIVDNLVAALKLAGLPETQCFSNPRDFIQALTKLLLVEIPAGAKGVIFSSQQPSQDNATSLWVRTDTSGGLVGLYAFQGGQWKPFYDLIIGSLEVRWIVGDSNNPPDGWALIRTGDDLIPTYVVNSLIAQYVPNPLGGFSYFAVRFKGY